MEPFNPLYQPVAPGPQLLQLPSTGPMVSAPPFDIGLSQLWTQPQFVLWLTQIARSPDQFSLTTVSSSSGSSRSSTPRLPGKIRKFDTSPGSSNHETDLTPDPKRVKTTAALSAPPALPRHMRPLAVALNFLSGSTLMKTRLQRRDEAFKLAIEPHLPTVLVNLVRDYAGSEMSLSPLERNAFGKPKAGSSNDRIMQHIFTELGENYPGSALFQNEIIETHHRKTLDCLFTTTQSVLSCPDLLRRVVAKDLSAVRQRKDQLRSVVNYLPFSECERLLSEEMDATVNEDDDDDEAGDPGRDDINFLKCANSTLLIEALRHKQYGPETEIIRRREVEFNRGKAMWNQARLQLKAKHQDAHQIFLQALNIFCNLNKKREAVEVVIQLLKQSGQFPGTDFADIVKLFSAAKAICLCYPVSDDLYAKLLFTMDDPCSRQFEFTLLHQLYDEAWSNHIQLNYSCQAKFYYHHIHADHRAGLSSLDGMRRINTGLEHCLSYFINHAHSPHNDLSRDEFYCSTARLYQLAAKLTDLHATQYEHWSKEQRAESLALIKYENPDEMSRSLPFHADRRVGLTFKAVPPATPPSLRLLSASAEYYKNAVKIMQYLGPKQKPQTKRLIVLFFNDLVEFYQKHRNAGALEQLLDKKIAGDFNKIADFKSRLPGWRKMLKQLQGRSVAD